MQILTVPKDRPLRLAFSPDGGYLAGGGGQAFHVWDLSGSSKPLWSLSKSDIALNFVFTSNAAEVRGGSYSDFSRYNVRTGGAERDDALCAFDPAQFSPDGRFGLAVDSDRDRRTLWLKCAAIKSEGCAEVWQKRIDYNPDYEPAGYRVLLFSADGARFIRVAGRSKCDGKNMVRTGLEVFDSGSGDLLSEWVGELPYHASDGATSPTGTVALLNGRALYIVAVATPDAKPVKRVNPSPKPLEAVAFSPDGSRLVTVGRDASATMWDGTTWEVVRRYEWKVGALKSVAFAPDGLRCAVGSDSGQIVVWDLDG